MSQCEAVVRDRQLRVETRPSVEVLTPKATFATATENRVRFMELASDEAGQFKIDLRKFNHLPNGARCKKAPQSTRKSHARNSGAASALG